MNLRWSRAAEAQLEDTREYIARENPAAAIRTVVRIIKATERLERYPNSGRRGRVDGTLELVVSGLPYVVVYEVRNDLIEIHGIFHTARDPSKRGARENRD